MSDNIKGKRKGFVIEEKTANLLMPITNDKKIADFVREFLAFNVYGIKPRIYGNAKDGMDFTDLLLVEEMQRAIEYSEENIEKYKARCEVNKENRQKGITKNSDNSQPEQPAEPEPAPAPKKRTYARRNSKNEEKKELTPEEIAVKEKNDSGRQIFFDAWKEYAPDDKSNVKSRLIRADKDGRNELMERIADIGSEDMINAVHRYMSETDPKYKKSPLNFFSDRIFENYIGVNYKPRVSGYEGYGDVEFDLQEQYKLQNERMESVGCSGGDVTDEELEERFKNF